MRCDQLALDDSHGNLKKCEPNLIMIYVGRPDKPLTVSLLILLFQALTELALELGCSAVLTGHTATDRAETLLVNLVRGAGADGMQVRFMDPLSSPLLLSLPSLPSPSRARSQNPPLSFPAGSGLVPPVGSERDAGAAAAYRRAASDPAAVPAPGPAYLGGLHQQ